jgi:hypothetical protein
MNYTSIGHILYGTCLLVWITNISYVVGVDYGVDYGVYREATINVD